MGLPIRVGIMGASKEGAYDSVNVTSVVSSMRVCEPFDDISPAVHVCAQRCAEAVNAREDLLGTLSCVRIENGRAVLGEQAATVSNDAVNDTHASP